MAEYITKFYNFLVRCGENESDTVVFLRFRLRLRKDLRLELFMRDISTLEQGYQLVQDLDRAQDFSLTRHTDYTNNTNKTTIIKSQSQSHFGSSNSTQKHDDKGIGVYSESSRSVQQNRCFKCQWFSHIAAQSE